MSPQPAAAREVLAFYAEAGVDALVGEEPVNHFAQEAGEAPRATPARTLETRSAPPPSAPNVAPPAPDVAAMEAREAVKNVQTLEELRDVLGRFEGCALRATATQLVFADGNPEARVMFVGEAPGDRKSVV